MDKPKIFLFINSKQMKWYESLAIAEDGHVLTNHISSNKPFAQYDMGYTSDLKHDDYDKHYPDGYELVWVDDPINHKELMNAYALNQKLSIKNVKENV